jgi:hypothetical protein
VELASKIDCRASLAMTDIFYNNNFSSLRGFEKTVAI